MCCGGREFEGEVRRGKERLTQHTDKSQGYYVIQGVYMQENTYVRAKEGGGRCSNGAYFQELTPHTCS